MASIKDLTPKETPTWCPGCGDYTIISSLKNALSEVGFKPEETVICSGIGCGSKAPHYVKTFGLESLHGRGIPSATGVKLANNKLNVIVVAGDGDTYGIGCNHFMHTMRRNLNMTFVIQDNAIYGLTKGQTSPTSQQGFKSNSTPTGVLEEPVNPMRWAITGGATYVARGYAMDIAHLKELLVGALKHNGISVVDVLQPCVTYNKFNTAEWYKQRVYHIEKHDPKNKEAAMKLAEEWGDKIPIGLFYHEEGKPTYEEGIPQIAKQPLKDHDISNVDISKLLEKYK